MNTAFVLCEDPDYKCNYLVVPATHDTHVESLDPTDVNGHLPTIVLNVNNTGYLKFDISATDINTSVISAKLRLYFSSTTAPSDTSVYEVDSDLWDESTVNYNSRPLLGDLIDSVNMTIEFSQYEVDVTDWVKDRIINEKDYISFGITSDVAGSFNMPTSENANTYPYPILVIEYGNPLDLGDSRVKLKTYTFEDVTDVDTYNNIFYNTNIGSMNLGFAGSETNTAYINVGIDDANYYRFNGVDTALKYVGIRFENKIDENVTKIQRIVIKHKGTIPTYVGGPLMYKFDNGIYNNDALSYVVTENIDTIGCLNDYSIVKYYYNTVATNNVYISNNFDKYINDDGVLKYSFVIYKYANKEQYFDTYYYEVDVYYIDDSVTPVLPPDDDVIPGDPSVYPDLTDDTPIISVDGEYTGDLQNVLFRNLFNINDKIGFPTWSLILLVGIIGVWKRRPELVIFCGLLFMFLLFFGYKLSMAVI